jgi:hypothetical protein
MSAISAMLPQDHQQEFLFRFLSIEVQQMREAERVCAKSICCCPKMRSEDQKMNCEASSEQSKIQTSLKQRKDR